MKQEGGTVLHMTNTFTGYPPPVSVILEVAVVTVLLIKGGR
jgi:hypothetical protein